jgi:hypothetical protein
VEAFLLSTGVVALAEMGDKTQLLALVLAARYRRPVPVVMGIFVATLANHALARRRRRLDDHGTSERRPCDGFSGFPLLRWASGR